MPLIRFCQVFFLVLSVLLISCTREKSPSGVNPAETPVQASGVYSLELSPHEANRKTTLSLAAKGFALSEAQVVWLVNDSVAANEGQDRMNASETARGDIITAKAMLRGREIRSNSVRIGNTPPDVTSVKLVPEVFRPGDKLSVVAVGSDVDGDDVTFKYQWTVNGAPAGNGKSLELALKRGDQLEVVVTPFDGTDVGVGALVRREIGNMPPIVVDHKEFTFDGNVYTYQVKASDPDGDDLSFSLEPPVEGMAVDPSKGLVTWTVPPDFKGVKNVTIVVNDGHNGIARYGLAITIQ